MIKNQSNLLKYTRISNTIQPPQLFSDPNLKRFNVTKLKLSKIQILNILQHIKNPTFIFIVK